ncbi:MAG TPA: cytidine deaminase [Candidatus Kapabacteria bacterium]|jgi:cytidine deaminase|nr:cytidine deaminase [Candidatus Kapabacteria bacterium]HPU24454.1 cytidine deaminase [Candidatus Kapabacteria bacterium]
MKKVELNQLSKRQIELVDAAIEARKNAYAPYSNFKVGAAVLDEEDNIHTGCNIESIDYTLTSHAEMVAIDAMVKSGCRNLKEIAIVLKSTAYSVPCGLCRQKMVEFSNGNVSIVCVNLDSEEKIKEIFTTSLSELLPYAFKQL